MPFPYPDERQVESWTSDQVVESLEAVGVRVVSYPLNPRSERQLPADFIFIDEGRSKIFGLQYKALYANHEDGWRLSTRQHRMLTRYPWVYYGLSDLRRVSDHRVALHMLRFVRAADMPVPARESAGRVRVRTSDVRRYSRWGPFLESFRRCRVGIRVRSRSHLHELVPPSLAEVLHDLFVVDWERSEAVRMLGRRLIQD